MNVLVCVKFVPDPAQIEPDAQGRPNFARAPFRINTFDENAIEAALQICAQQGGDAVALSVANADPPREILLRTLAMGISALYLVKDPQRMAGDSYRVARVLAAAATAVAAARDLPKWDLVVCGEASVDEYNAQVGPRLAAALGVPAVTYARRLEVQGGRLIADRDLEDRVESVDVALPALVTVGMETNQARIPTVLQLMSAGRKPIEALAVETLPGFDGAAMQQRPALRTLEISSPPSARKNVVLHAESAHEAVGILLERLRADGEIAL